MRPTKNDIDVDTRKQMSDLLSQRVYDAIDLQLQTKQAHWNVKGPNFIGLHKLFDDLHEIIEGHVDTMAERIVQLGGFACGTAKESGEESTLDPYPLEVSDWQTHVELLSNAYAQFGKLVRDAISESDDAGDLDTSDIFIQVSRDVDKALWFIESHLPVRQQSVQSPNGPKLPDVGRVR